MRSKAQSILWHQGCLDNSLATLAREESILAQLTERVERAKVEAEFYQLQINEAINQGKPSFDRDRFLKSR